MENDNEFFFSPLFQEKKEGARGEERRCAATHQSINEKDNRRETVRTAQNISQIADEQVVDFPDQ